MKLSEAKILITGAGRGIGNFLALNLVQEVEKLVVIDNNQQLLNELPKMPRLSGYHGDIADPVAVQNLIRKIFEEEGGINVCINNAGMNHSEPLLNIL